jgi:hypothetical protein
MGVASNIELLIFDGTTPLAQPPAQASVVALAGGLSAIPVTGTLLAALSSNGACAPIRVGWMLRDCVCRLAQRLSQERWMLYVAAETFGGLGTQEAMGWRNCEIVYGPSGSCDVTADLEDGYRVVQGAGTAINVGLRFMGIVAADRFDEFAAAGLDTHRFTDDWLTR